MKRQAWLKNFNWDALNAQTMEPPFVPPKEDNYNSKIVNEGFKDENDERFNESLALIDKPKI